MFLLVENLFAMHVYAHGKDCQCLFSPRQIHGLGKTIEGEGVERVHSYLSRSIRLTQHETAENRHMDIVLVCEQYNQSKIRGLVSWTVTKLVGAFSELDSIRLMLADNWATAMESNYDDVTCSHQRMNCASRLMILPELLFQSTST
ncbi:hypothetical protein BDR26DRAFT_455675 [Obelidium mucronatum]|nr:hypothetical protein BDR26DRAFT_455675 [Obelidium mucronatum]